MGPQETPPQVEIKAADTVESLSPVEQLEQNEDEGREIQRDLADSQVKLIDTVKPLVDENDAEELDRNASENNGLLLLSRFYADNEAYGESQILSSGISQQLGTLGLTMETYMFADSTYNKKAIDVSGQTMRFALEIPDVGVILSTERALSDAEGTMVMAEVTVFENDKFTITPYAASNIGDKSAEVTMDVGASMSSGNFYLEGNVGDVGGDRAFSLLASNEVGHGINVYASAEHGGDEGLIATAGVGGIF